MIRRLLACIGIDVVLVAAAALVLGRPDLGQAGSFGAGEYPSFEAAEAALEVLLWAIVLAVVGVLTASIVSEAVRRVLRTPWQRHHLTAVLAVAILLLVAATLRHSTATVVMCCGDPSEARSVAR